MLLVISILGALAFLAGLWALVTVADNELARVGGDQP
jgi:hypothetical protein